MDESNKKAVHSKMIVGWQKKIIERCIRLHILLIALSVYRNLFLALKTLKRLMDFNRIDRKEAGRELGGWLFNGCTVEPRYGKWSETIKSCECDL